MRQGNVFSQWVDRDPNGDIFLRLPLELVHDWEDAKRVIWVDNRDGSYTLTPAKEMANSYGEALRETRKIVVNRCYGGFSLSHEGMLAYARHKGLTLYPRQGKFSLVKYWTYWLVPEPIEVPDNWATLPLEERQRINAEFSAARISDTDLDRDDPALIAAVEELGTAANGEFAQLEIVEIPDDVEWEICEYDGGEWVAEKHRTW